MKAVVTLDESRYGVPEPSSGLGYEFYYFALNKRTKEKERRVIAVRVVNQPVLAAVTKEQFKVWKGREIFARPIVMDDSVVKNRE